MSLIGTARSYAWANGFKVLRVFFENASGVVNN